MRRPEIREVLQRLREEEIEEPDDPNFDAEEYLENLDFDRLEECFEGYISSLDQLSHKIKDQEMAIMQLDADKLESEKQEIEKHMGDLKVVLQRVEAFEQDPSYMIKTEEDADELERRLTNDLLGTAEYLETNYAEFARRQADIDAIRIENAFLREQLERVPLRNAETFESEVQKELAVKYPYLFKSGVSGETGERPREEWEDEVDAILEKYKSGFPADTEPEEQPADPAE